jgi:hypothetical protein
MTYLSRLKEVGKPLEGEPSKGAKAPFDPFAGSDAGPFPGLPGDVVTGLLRLKGARAPRLRLPSEWAAVVADALQLAGDGWAAQALGLGWLPHELFGCSVDAAQGPDHDGLAVWLAGRRVLLLDALSCIVEDGARARSLFYCRAVRLGGRMLWELG